MSLRQPEPAEPVDWAPGSGTGRVLDFPGGDRTGAGPAPDVDEARQRVREERARIARDLHDVALQDLFASTMQLQALARATADPAARRELELVVQGLRGTSRKVRRSIFGLGTREPGSDLHTEVTGLVRRAGAVLKLAVDLEVRGRLDAVDGPVGDDLVAVLAEALSNAAKHAEAEAVAVRIDADPVRRRLRLTVDDDGAGVAADAPLHGLGNLRERAERHGGSLEVGSGPEGGGTRLVWTVRLAS